MEQPILLFQQPISMRLHNLFYGLNKWDICQVSIHTSLLTDHLDVGLLETHRVGVDLAHVPSAVGLLDVADT